MDYNKERISELVVRLKNGDKSAFDELYRLTSSRVFFVALKITKNEHDAEDIIQESYISALNKIDTLENPDSFVSWFSRIVANKSKSFLRKKTPQLFEEAGVEEGSVVSLEKESFSPEENADRAALREAVMSAVDELSEEKRACVMMMYFDDMSVNDISESLGVSVSAVKNRLLSARRDLKGKFEKRKIISAYSIAPMGAVTWALREASEIFSQNFESSANAAKILSGIGVAGTAAAVGTAGAAAGTGTAVKATAALAIAKKIAAGVAVAGIIAGSTAGITSLVRDKNAKADETTTVAAVETTVQAVEEESKPVNTLEIDFDSDEDSGYDSKYHHIWTDGLPKRYEYLGTVKEGRNELRFTEGWKEYYCDFEAEKSGYYAFSSKGTYHELSEVDATDYFQVFAPEDPQSGNLDSFSPLLYGYNGENGITVFYLEEGTNLLMVSLYGDLESAEVSAEYLGEKIEDIRISDEQLEKVIGYNENMSSVKIYSDEIFMNYFDITLVFSSGEEFVLNGVATDYFVEGGLKDGKNTARFEFADYTHYDTVVAHYPEYYVKDIEVSNLDEFTAVKMGRGGFEYQEPENYTVTVTYGDGTKEELDGAQWDKVIRKSGIPELEVDFHVTSLRGREAIYFIVSIGEHEYIRELCTVTDIDLIGYRKMLNEITALAVTGNAEVIEISADRLENGTKDMDDFLWNTAEYASTSAIFIAKSLKRAAGFELDYAITLFKVCTENEFDLIG